MSDSVFYQFTSESLRRVIVYKADHKVTLSVGNSRYEIPWNIFQFLTYNQNIFNIKAPIAISADERNITTRGISPDDIKKAIEALKIKISGNAVDLDEKQRKAMRLVASKTGMVPILRCTDEDLQTLNFPLFYPRETKTEFSFVFKREGDSEQDFVFKCSNALASLISKKAEELIKEQATTLIISHNQYIDDNQYQRELEKFFNITRNIPLEVNVNNFSLIYQIASDLGSEELYLRICAMPFENDDTKWAIEGMKMCVYEPDGQFLARAQENFLSLSSDKKLSIPPPLMKVIINERQINEDPNGMLRFLMGYYAKWGKEAMSLFDLVDFRQINSELRSEFCMEIHPSHLGNKAWTSIGEIISRSEMAYAPTISLTQVSNSDILPQ